MILLRRALIEPKVHRRWVELHNWSRRVRGHFLRFEWSCRLPSCLSSDRTSARQVDRGI